MDTKGQKKLESDYRNARSSVLIAGAFALVALSISLLLPRVSPYGWIAFGFSLFGCIGWFVTMVNLKSKLDKA